MTASLQHSRYRILHVTLCFWEVGVQILVPAEASLSSSSELINPVQTCEQTTCRCESSFYLLRALDISSYTSLSVWRHIHDPDTVSEDDKYLQVSFSDALLLHPELEVLHLPDVTQRIKQSECESSGRYHSCVNVT